MEDSTVFRFHQTKPAKSINYLFNLRKTASMTSIFYIFIFLITSQILECYGEPILESTTDYAQLSKSSTSNLIGPATGGSSSSISSTGSGSIFSSGTSTTNNYVKGTTKSNVAVTPIPKISKRAGSSTLQIDSKSKKLNSGSSTTNNVNNNNSQEIQQLTTSAIQNPNRSREALSHEGSERETIVYLSDSPAYIPAPSYRGARPSSSHSIPPSSSGSSSISSSLPSGAGSNSGGGSYHHSGASVIDLENWRPDPWDRDYNKRPKFNNTRVQHIEAECQDDYMKIRIGFNGSFTGLLYSAGYAYDPDCMYINGSGRDYYEFYIQLNRCGTLGKNALHDDNRKNPTNFMWNTITVQYNPLIEEEFDEHFKVTCEYGYDFWKTVTFPFLDVEVATGNPVVFTLSPPECYMEIRNGYGIAGTRVTGPVRVGDPLTLIIYMRSKYDGFDIVVNDCYAHNGAQKRIQLIDEYGCPVDDKLISRFRGTWSDSGVYETQVYAYMKTFRFTGSPALYIECDVRMCHGRCPSQPCHWRNIKTVSKREISNHTYDDAETSELIGVDNNESIKETSQSENINLFQSLRVLQEGEDDTEDEFHQQNNHNNNIHELTLNHETCIRTTVLSALSAAFSLLLCILSASLIIACSKLRYRKKKEHKLYNTYFTHKTQQID